MSDPFASFPNVPNQGASQKDVSGNKIAAGICGLLLGALGVHKFILGYSKEGLLCSSSLFSPVESVLFRWELLVSWKELFT